MRGTAILDDTETATMMSAFDDSSSKGELVPSGGFGAMAEGVSITNGIITAQKVDVKRDEADVLKKLATRAAVVGTDWFYRFPVKKKDGGTDWITGPSIKCANNVARLYGNCQVDTRVQDAGASWIIYARFVDYETGFSYTRPFQQAKNASRMGGKGPEAEARRLDIALQIGVSKAIRNVVCNALETFTDFAFGEAQRNLVGKVGAKLDAYKAKVLERLGELKVDVKRVEAALGRPTAKWLAPEVAQIIAELQAIADGMATIDETWAPLEPTRNDPPASNSEQSGKPDATGPTTEQNGQDGQQQQQQQTDQPDTVKADAGRWKIDAVGQGPILDGFWSLLDGECKTEADVDALNAAHAVFIAKLSKAKQNEVAEESAKRKAQLAPKVSQ